MCALCVCVRACCCLTCDAQAAAAASSSALLNRNRFGDDDAYGRFNRMTMKAPLEGVALLDLHGSQDETVPANWSLSSDGYYYTPTKDIFGGDRYSTGWLKANGCKGAGKHYPTPYDGEKEL